MDTGRRKAGAYGCLSLCVFSTEAVFIRQKRQKINHSMKDLLWSFVSLRVVVVVFRVFV